VKIFRARQAAVKLGISKQSLIRYEKIGLVPKQRRNCINSWREYTQEDIENIKRILKKGITMVELVMVILVISIIGVAAIPRIQTFYAFKLSSAVKTLVADIRYAQQMAIARHTNIRVTFSTTGENYTVREETPMGSNTWTVMRHPFTKGNYTVNYLTDLQYKGIDVSNVNFAGGMNLTFDWQGSPSSNGTVVYMLKGGTKTVAVEAQTGKVSVQ
jgi:Tfp pilus assembly protein FimT